MMTCSVYVSINKPETQFKPFIYFNNGLCNTCLYHIERMRKKDFIQIMLPTLIIFNGCALQAKEAIDFLQQFNNPYLALDFLRFFWAAEICAGLKGEGRKDLFSSFFLFYVFHVFPSRPSLLTTHSVARSGFLALFPFSFSVSLSLSLSLTHSNSLSLSLSAYFPITRK